MAMFNNQRVFLFVDKNGFHRNDDTVDGCEILYYFGWLKPYKYWDKPPFSTGAGFRWSIHSMTQLLTRVWLWTKTLAAWWLAKRCSSLQLSGVISIDPITNTRYNNYDEISQIAGYNVQETAQSNHRPFNIGCLLIMYVFSLFRSW